MTIADVSRTLSVKSTRKSRNCQKAQEDFDACKQAITGSIAQRRTLTLSDPQFLYSFSGECGMLNERLICWLLSNREMEKCSVRRSASPDSNSDKGADHEDRGARRKHRRGRHRRKWKPYSKMSAEEKREHAAREAARAAKREAELMGKPAAPWNTTQFLMEDHGCTKVHIPSPRMSRTLSVESSFSEEDFNESPEEELMEHGLFLEQDFESAYREMEQERLQKMSKQELVQHCMELSQEVAVTQDRVRNECNARISELELRVAELQRDNDHLRGDRTPTAASPPQVACSANS